MDEINYLILKSFINFFNIIYIIYFLSFLFLINNFLVESNIRKKLTLFFLILILICFISLYYNLDGIILIFFISELTIILIFITIYSQLYSYDKKKSKISNYFVIIIILFLNFSFYNTNIISYNNFYSIFNINLNDFYYIYNFFFEKQILLTFFIIFILSIYSIFFIMLYFNLKYLSNLKKKKKKSINFLKKQNMVNQSNYKIQIRTFQKK